MKCIITTPTPFLSTYSIVLDQRPKPSALRFFAFMNVLKTQEQPQRTRNSYLRTSQIHDNKCSRTS